MPIFCLVAGELVSHLSDLIDRHQLEGISEEQDGLLLRPSSFGEEFPLDLINNGREDWLNDSSQVVLHRLIVGRAIQNALGQT